MLALDKFAQAIEARVREATLEEIAEYVDRNLMSCREYAEAIRALKNGEEVKFKSIPKSELRDDAIGVFKP